MTKIGDGVDPAEREAAHAETFKDAWSRTLGDVDRMAEGRAEAGWETLVLPAGDTAPEPPDDGPSGRYGLVYVVPGDRADRLGELLTEATFPEYDVYRTTVEGRVFIVTELRDPDHEAVVYVAGNYELRTADRLIETVADSGTMYTHLQKLDGTEVATFEHEDWQKFFPNAETFV
ncbi:Uncharacterized protein HSRCO_0091 [Halanaeroarchaeum sp. HSR-CO]|uniref:DUF7529 family protein n=1 Tax=Halanaeroarchaeum sp. HSR-CO TaxID=2866382 RepID=UPI00217E2B36|nr:hypothetical protein [Halanaeroarchaeum sp. HSR-CO]UWG46393.1 Uncharacterized protein HSRCO_0091 [Halanaeroarchaeum sp. HSR-CO]